MAEITFRVYRSGDEQEINQLFNEVFKTNRTLAEWHWQYRQHPLNKYLWITVAESNGRIIAHFAHFPAIFKYKDKEVIVPIPIDFMVSDEFRKSLKKHGMLAKLFDMQFQFPEKEIVSFGLAFPNELSYRYGKFISESKDLFFLSKMRKTITIVPKLYARGWRNRLILLIARWISITLFKRFSYALKFQSPDLQVKEISYFDDRINRFWSTVAKDYPIIRKRDREFLNWRYCNKPRTKYTIYQAESNDSIQGYIVISISSYTNEGYILDILAQRDEKVVQSLISQALRYFVKKGVDVIHCWMLEGNLIYSVLQKNGFWITEPGSRVLYRIVNEHEVELPFIVDKNKWYLTIGDVHEL